MYTLSVNMWFQKLMKQFFFGIDQVVYNFISSIYDLLITIARTSVLSQADILDMADRIYKLLAVFMIFKVTFSLIMYVVNPDDFSDKSKGVAKLGTNIIISLSLLILTPYIFNYAFKLQTIILEDNSLATLIFGGDKDCGGEGQPECTSDFLNTAGDEIAFMTMSAFFTPNTSIPELQKCITLQDVNGRVNQECSGLGSDYEPVGETKNTMYSLLENDTNKYFKKKDIQNYVAGIEHENLGLMFRQEMAVATTKDNTQFIMDYKYIFSTVVGVVIILLLITFCMDVAVRSIKLAMLQLIAPIPIISYVDPKSGKDGMFKKWYQMCFKTYLSLFIRLLALYFAVYIISRVAEMKLIDVVDGSYQTNAFVSIFIIIGALMFAKQFPDILKNLGINLDGGGFTLNPLKKLEKDAVGGKQISKLAKGVGTAAGGAALVGGASLLTGKGLRGTGAAMGKAISGGLKGEKFGKNFSNSYAAGLAKKQQVTKMKNDGVSPMSVAMENFKNKFIGMTAKDQLDDFNGSIKAIQDGYKTYYDGVLGSDKVAKMLEQRRVAALNRGDHDGATRLQDAIDARVKAVKDAGGQVALGISTPMGADMLNAFGEDIENGKNSYADFDAVKSTFELKDIQKDKGLQDIDHNIAKIIKHVDDKYDGRFRYEAGDLGSLKQDADGTLIVGDLKGTNGKSKSVARAAAASGEAKEITEKYKYVDTKSKK